MEHLAFGEVLLSYFFQLCWLFTLTDPHSSIPEDHFPTDWMSLGHLPILRRESRSGYHT